MKKICIIPARGGSKRIPRKNIKNFHGKPIIGYSIEAALSSNLFDEVMVSTDDPEIEEVAKSFGATVPFLRSTKNSDDFSTTSDVLTEVLSNYEDAGTNFDIFCCLYPTAPFVTAQRLLESFKKLIDTNSDSVLSVVRFDFPPQRGLIVKEGKIAFMYPENLNVRSQDLEPIFHDAGQFYWSRIDIFKKERKVFTDKTSFILLSENEVQDIDTLEDWEIAEFKYSFSRRK